MSTRLNAYNVWLCGGCDVRTDEKDNGDRMCMACGALFDHAGRNITDDGEERGLADELVKEAHQ